MIFRKNKINNYYNNKAKLSKIYIEKNHVDLFFHFFEIHKYEFEFCIKLDDNYVKSIFYEDNPKNPEGEHYIVKYNDYEYWINYDKAMYIVKNLMCLKMIEKNFIVDIKMRQKNSKEIYDEGFITSKEFKYRLDRIDRKINKLLNKKTNNRKKISKNRS